MKKKILIAVLALIVIVGGGYAALYMNPEGGMGFLRKTTTVENPLNSYNKPVSLKQIEQKSFKNNIQPIKNTFELYDPIKEFEKLTIEPLTLALSTDLPRYQIKLFGGEYPTGFQTPEYENVQFKLTLCNSESCNFDIADSSPTSSKTLEIDDVYIGGNGGTNFGMFFRELFDNKTAIVQISRFIPEDANQTASTIQFTIATSDPSYPIQIAEMGAGIEASLKLKSCSQSTTLNCTLEYSDKTHPINSTTLSKGESFILQSNSGKLHKVTLISGRNPGTPKSTAVIEIEKRG